MVYPAKKSKNRYEDKFEVHVNQSSFLDSILDRSSSIFSIRSKRDKKLEDVRKKIDDAWNLKAAVLYDDEKDTVSAKHRPGGDSQCKSTRKSTYPTEDEYVNIGNELSAFLKSNKSSFDLGGRGSLFESSEAVDNIP
jgi:hypothetical protein